MTRLFYRLKNGYGELTESSLGDSEQVVITVDGVSDGTLLIADRYLTLKDGRVSTDLRSLKDGAVKPLLISANGSFRLEPFLKDGNKITALPTEDFVIRKMLLRLGAAEAELCELKYSIAELKEMLGIYRLKDPDGE